MDADLVQNQFSVKDNRKMENLFTFLTSKALNLIKKPKCNLWAPAGRVPPLRKNVLSTWDPNPTPPGHYQTRFKAFFKSEKDSGGVFFVLVRALFKSFQALCLKSLVQRERKEKDRDYIRDSSSLEQRKEKSHFLPFPPLFDLLIFSRELVQQDLVSSST